MTRLLPNIEQIVEMLESDTYLGRNKVTITGQSAGTGYAQIMATCLGAYPIPQEKTQRRPLSFREVDLVLVAPVRTGKNGRR